MSQHSSGKYIPLKPVVAIIGDASLQGSLRSFLETHHNFQVIPCPDAPHFSALLHPQPALPPPPPPLTDALQKGILRADWLEKHQTRCPAVAAVVISRQQATGDPSAWANLVASLESIRTTTTTRSKTKIRVVVVVVQPSEQKKENEEKGASSPPLPEDRAAMVVRHSGAADRSCLLTCEPTNVASLQAVGVLLRAQATAFYAADAKRRLTLYSSLSSVEESLAAAFKLGGLAEQRGDWVEAAQLYDEAYGYVMTIGGGGGGGTTAPPSIHRFLEVRAVAAVVNHRLLALLLGPVNDPTAAAHQLSTHLALFNSAPVLLQTTTTTTTTTTNHQPGLGANHAAWIRDQYQIAATLLQSNSTASHQVLLPPDFRAAPLLVEAARCEARRTEIVDSIIHSAGGSLREAFEGVCMGQSYYYGQLESMNGDSIGSGRGNDDDDDDEIEAWLQYSEVTDANSGSSSSITLLRAARNAASSSSSSSSSSNRNASGIDVLLGEALLNSGDAGGAAAVLQEAALQYRRDGWMLLLWRVLLLLRTCAACENDKTTHAMMSLEAAALDAGDDEAQRRAIAQGAIEELMQLTSAAVQCTVTDKSDAWFGIVQLSAGFSTSSSSSSSSSSGGGVQNEPPPVFVLVLRNNLPLELPLLSAAISFEDGNSAFDVDVTAQISPGSSSSSSSLPPSTPVNINITVSEIAPHKRHSHSSPAQSPSSSSPWLAATKLTLRFGQGASVTYSLPHALTPTPPQLMNSTNNSILWGVVRTSLPPRLPPPQLILWLPETGLVGEVLQGQLHIVCGGGENVKASTQLQQCMVYIEARVGGKPASVLLPQLDENSNGLLTPKLQICVPESATNKATVDFHFRVAAEAGLTLTPGEDLSFAVHLQYTVADDAIKSATESGSLTASASIPILLPFEIDVVVGGGGADFLLMEEEEGGDNDNSLTSQVQQSEVKHNGVGVVNNSTSINKRTLSVEDSYSHQRSVLNSLLAPRLLSSSPSSSRSGQDSYVFTVPMVTSCSAQVKLSAPAPSPSSGSTAAAAAAAAAVSGVGALSISDVAFDLNSYFSKRESSTSTNTTTSRMVLQSGFGSCCTNFHFSAVAPSSHHNHTQKQQQQHQLPSLGAVSVRWTRAQAATLTPHYPSSQHHGDTTTLTTTTVQEAQLTLQLPSALIISPLLMEKPRFPFEAVLGVPISLVIDVSAAGRESSYFTGEVDVRVGGECNGWMIGGPRETTVNLSGGCGGDGSLKESEEQGAYVHRGISRHVVFSLVAYHVGYLQLPEVFMSVPRSSSSGGRRAVNVTQGCQVFVRACID